MVFAHAIVRPPSANFAEGLTTVDLGAPDYQVALEQHEAYCVALQACGLILTRLAPDDRFPDSTFVEDTAVLTNRRVILARPGAPDRVGEVNSIANLLTEQYTEVHAIRSPGTLDAGDVCETADHFFIGISLRTNEYGAQQLASLLREAGYTTDFIDIRGCENILHLKSGIAPLGDNRLVVIDSLAHQVPFHKYELVPIDPGDEYAANCVRINDHLLIASGFPRLERRLNDLGYKTIALEMSEFQKMDGGLSCLSLRY